jgi:hypothetical protein
MLKIRTLLLVSYERFTQNKHYRTENTKKKKEGRFLFAEVIQTPNKTTPEVVISLTSKKLVKD